MHSDGAASLQYALPGASLISDCPQLKSELSQLVAASPPVILDATALQRIDTAGLQLLCAFVAARRRQQLVTEWRGVPAALSQAGSLLGLSSELGLPQQPA